MGYRIDKYDLGASIGQLIGKLIEADKEKFKNGEFDEEFQVLLEKSLILKATAVMKLSEHPVIGPMMDANLKY